MPKLPPAFRSLLTALSLTVGGVSFAAPILVPTLDDNTVSGTRKLRGSTIDYTVTITNTGDANATSVTLTNPLPANTADVAGSLRVTPIAVDDAYADIVGNTQSTVAAPGLLANDFDPDGAAGTFSIKAGSVSRVSGTATGGALTAAANGSFTYTPGVGQTGTERFQYTITDANGLDSVTPGFVDFTINSPRVWYVQNGTTNGDGRSNTPFNSLTSAAAAATLGTDIIYVLADIGANAKLNGNVVLKNNQLLLGQGVALVVNAQTLFSPSTAPTLTNTAGDVVTLASGNTVRGLLIGNHPGGTGLLGASVGTLTINSVTVNGTGKIADLTGAAGNSVAITLDNATTTSSTSEGLKLTGLIGSFTVTAGAISGAAGADVLINGGTANVALGNAITNTAGRSVDVQNKTGGTVTFSGALSDTGTGLFLNANTGATINFTGGISASTGASDAFTATGGGTVSATQNNTTIVNTLTTTTATALNVTSTTIGASGLTFRSISAGTAGSGPAMGVNLNATGVAGGVTVTGTGAAGTGGTIQKCTHGIFANTTRNLSLSYMNITNNGLNQSVAGSASTAGGDLITGNNLSAVANVTLLTTTNVTLTNVAVTGSSQMGINGNGLSGLTISNSTITGNGNESFESGVVLQNASGAVSITGSNVRDNRARELNIANGNGITSTLTLTNSQFGHTASGTGTAESQQGVLLQLFGTSNTTIAASGLTISNNTGVGFTANGFQLNADNGGPVINGSITGSTFDNNAAHVLVNAGGTSAVTFDTTNSTAMTKAALQAINYTVLGGSTAITANLTGTISGNSIDNSALPNANAHAIDINSGTTWAGQMHIKVANNSIQGVAGGIIATLDGNDTAAASTPRVDLRITGNTVNNPVATAAEEAIKLNAAVTSAHPKLIVGWDVGGAGLANTVAGHWANGASEASIFLRNRFTAASSIILPGYGGGAADDAAVQTYLAGRNSIAAPGGSGTTTLVTHNNTNPFSNGTVTTPLLFAPGGVEKGHEFATAEGGVTSGSAGVSLAASGLTSRESDVRGEAPESLNMGALRDDQGSLAEASITAREERTIPVLSQGQLDAAASAAYLRWAATGLTAEQLAALHEVQFAVADLPGWYLGEAHGSHLRVDRDAGGNGWFIDATPLEDAEFSTEASGTRRYTDSAGAPAGRIDLLTTLLHEMGHALGLDDTFADGDRDSVMFGYLTKGERRLPAPGQAAGAMPKHAGEMHFLAGPVALGTLPPGKSVRITYSVTIANPLVPNTTGTIVNTGTVTAGGGISVATDDPELAGQQSTVTTVSAPPVLTDVPKAGTEDTTVTFSAADFTGHFSDPNGDTLASVRIASLPANGTLKVGAANATVGLDVPAANLGTITFVPTADFNGATSFLWNAKDNSTDALLADANASVNITLVAVNDPPVLAAIETAALAYTENAPATPITTATTVADVDSATLTGATVQITVNYANGQDLLEFTSQNGITAIFTPATGLLTLSGTTTVANYQAALRTVTYRNPSDNPSTALRTVRFQVNDGDAANNLSNAVTRTIAVTAVNDLPVITGQNAVTTAEDTARTLTTADLLVSDPDNTYPTGFTVAVGAGANYTFAGATIAPALNYNGPLTVPVTVTDPSGGTSLSFNLAVTVTSVNDNPVAGPDTITRYPTQSVKVLEATLLANDSDPDNDTPLSITAVTAGANGATVTRSGGYVIYQPAPGFIAADSFTYTLSDGHGGTATGAVTVSLVQDNAPSLNVTGITTEPATGGGTQARVSFAGIPGRAYRVQSTDSLTPAAWTDRQTITANAQGVFEFVDPPPLPPMRFYRSVFP